MPTEAIDPPRPFCHTPDAMMADLTEGQEMECRDDEYEVLVWRLTTAMAVERSISRSGRCLCGRRPPWRVRLLSLLRG